MAGTAEEDRRQENEKNEEREEEKVTGVRSSHFTFDINIYSNTLSLLNQYSGFDSG